MRPVFVWVLALVAVPILLLFGVGFVTDNEIDSSMRLIMAPAYLLGVGVAPLMLARRLVSRGSSLSDAVAAALGLGVVVLALSLVVLAGGDRGARQVFFLVASVGLILAIMVWERSQGHQVPPRQDIR